MEQLIEPLTRREREVLALLAEGLTSPEIAERLTVALSSVKTHIQHLYGKLGVNGKRQAVARAKELGLLGVPPSGVGAQLPPEPKHNLPQPITRFFGREAEVAQIQEQLEAWRLVTLTGSGGVGKTRLSLRVAESVLDDFTDGVWFVELAPLSDPALVPQHVVTALGLRDEAGQPILDSLTAFLRSRRALLVLDNCEHLLEACARLAEALLRACPRLTLMASSREPLGIAGEAVFHVPSLSFPDPGHLPALDHLDEYTALHLFLDRARAILPNYTLTSHNAVHLARICQRLDGIPLALELAAARINFLNAEQLATRMDDAFRTLTGGSRTALPRHQTLRATIDWSYQLLNEAERLLLQRLSVFAGGCTLEAAEVVCAGEGLDGGDVLDILASLAAKSMLIADRQLGKEPRYHLLDMVRQYAHEKLEAAGETERLNRRHRDYFFELAETATHKLPTRESLLWGRRLLAERENLRLAMEWSFSEQGNLDSVEPGPRLLAPFINRAGQFSPHEWLDWCKRAIAWCQGRTGKYEIVHARLLGLHACCITGFDLPDGIAELQQAVEFSRRLGLEGRTVLMENLATLGGSLASLDDIERARAANAEAEAILHELGQAHFSAEEYLWRKAHFVGEKARLAVKDGRYGDAKRYAAENIRLAEENGQPWTSVGGHQEFGHACLELGEYEEARNHFLEALNSIAMGDPITQAYAERCVGMAELGLGNLDKALEYCRASVRDANEGFSKSGYMGTAIGLAAMIAAKKNQPIRAATLSGASKTRYAISRRKPWEDSSLDTLLPGWRDGPDYEALLRAFEAGQKMEVEQAVAYALATESAADSDASPAQI